MNNDKLIAYTFKDISNKEVGNPVATTENYISLFISVLTFIAVIYFAIQTIFAGYSFFSTKGDPKLMQVAREKIIYNILGLIIVVVAYGLASLIAKILGLNNIFDLQSVINTITP